MLFHLNVNVINASGSRLFSCRALTLITSGMSSVTVRFRVNLVLPLALSHLTLYSLTLSFCVISRSKFGTEDVQLFESCEFLPGFPARLRITISHDS